MNRSQVIFLFCLSHFALAQDKPLGTLIIESKNDKTPPPLFYRAEATTTANITTKEFTSRTSLTVHVLQGKPELFTFQLSGEAEITKIEGDTLLDWAVRKGEQPLLEIRPKLPATDAEIAKSFTFNITSRKEIHLPKDLSPLLLGPGRAVGFQGTIAIVLDPAVDARATDSRGLSPLQPSDDARALAFQTHGDASLVLAVRDRGTAARDIELSQLRLEGTLEPGARHAKFTLSGQVLARSEKGGSLEILSGDAAISSWPENADIQPRLLTKDGKSAYHLAFPRAGQFPFTIPFDAAVREENERLSIDFTVPSGAIAPVVLRGAEGLNFAPSAAVFPTPDNGQWIGFLPASGRCGISWRKAQAEEEGKLFFATQAVEEIRLGAGMLRQATAMRFQILQGKLSAAKIRIAGAGEILAVEGNDLLGWTLQDADGGQRVLDLRWNQALSGQAQLVIRGQSPLANLPAKITPPRLTPEGSFRHSGHLRLANEGAVRLEVSGAQGMIQMAPSQFPGAQAKLEGSRQVFVYRYPSAERSYEIAADQIIPEVSLAQVVVHELGETDRILSASVELDIREAPLRDWEILVPEDYAVVSVTGAEVADYILGSETQNSQRSLKVLFRQQVEGRQLIELRLERNLPAQAGPWSPPSLAYPSAKTVRGHLGLVTAPGYRLIPGALSNLAELPLSAFPRQVKSLRQAYRLRDAAWSAPMTVESLGQNIQAEVFHLYSLKEGNVYGSVLLNFFVVGAPATEWRLEVPAELGNIAVEGENVQGWRREGGQVVVGLYQPALGPSTLLLTFEKPMSARGGSLALGDIRPSNAQNERGYIQVVSASQVRFEASQVSAGLLRLEPLELPAEFRLLAGSPSLAVYQYSSRPFDLQCNLTWFEAGQTIDQILDYANLSSRVSRDGQVATEAKLYVKTRGQKPLRLRLPAGGKLWETKVAGRTINARQDGETIIVPLSASSDPNAFVEVLLRMGTNSTSIGKAQLEAPTFEAPTMVANWKVTADEGRLVVPSLPRGAELKKPPLTETGWEWLTSESSRDELFILSLVLVPACLLGWRRRSPIGRYLAMLLWLLVGLGSLFLALFAIRYRRPNHQTIEFTAPVLPSGQSLSLTVKNASVWEAMISWWGLAAIIFGLLLLVYHLVSRRAGGIGGWLGWLLLMIGALSQCAGATLFFTYFALFAIFRIVPGLWKLRREDSEMNIASGSSTQTAAVASMVLMLLLGFSGGSARAEEESPQKAVSQTVSTPEYPAADSLTQVWKIEKARLRGTMKIRVQGKAGESFLLLRAPAILTKFDGTGLRLAKQTVDSHEAYLLVLEQDGTFSGEAALEMPVPEGTTSFSIPSGLAAVEQVDIEIDQTGWEIRSPRAVRAEPLPGLAEGRSGYRLILGPNGESVIHLQARARDFAGEKTEFFAEVANLFVPGPGAVDGRHVLNIRPARGQVRDLLLKVPSGFTVSEVAQGPIGTWRFDPESGILRLNIEPAQAKPFAFRVETQRSLASLPADLSLSPLRVEQSSADVGTLGLGFGGEAQPDKVMASALIKINPDDFPGGLLATKAKDETPPVLHQAYRYGADGGTLSLSVVPVTPEVRTDTSQVLSLGDERVTLAVDITVNIMRAGLFHLSFPVPEGLELEGASGDSLSHWTESQENNTRQITLQLKGRTLGEQKFALSFSGPLPSAPTEWIVPRFTLREATRQTGQLSIVAGQGLRLQVASRRNVSQIDSREIRVNQPGSLAFRLLQADWELKLGMDATQPWVTAQLLQDVTLREGQTRTRLSLRYRVENSSVKSLRLELPITADEEQTLRASGSAVSDFVKVPNEINLWEIRLQRAILGPTDVTIDYRKPTQRDGGAESIPFARPRDTRQMAYWLAVRGSGRLELRVDKLGRGWQTTDWANVPTELTANGDNSVPSLLFRAAEPEEPISVLARNHSVAEALKLRVRSSKLSTILSPRGETFTKVDLTMEVLERGTLRVRLPESALLFNTMVNGESANVVRDGEAIQFYVFPKEEGDLADVTFGYQTSVGSPSQAFRLQAPRLSVPWQNVDWSLVLPEGYDLRAAKGNLERVVLRKGLIQDLDYAVSATAKRAAVAKDARDLLDKANQWLVQGEQEKASQAFSRAYKFNSLEPASNEDARVQLREVRNAQNLISLTAQRQSLIRDNASKDAGDDRQAQILKSASENPLLNGQLNYDQATAAKALEGNTAEETQALKRIAARLVSQQAAAEPALQSIEPILPQGSTVAEFRRAVQVNADQPLELNVRIARSATLSPWIWATTLAVLSLLLAAALRSMAKR